MDRSVQIIAESLIKIAEVLADIREDIRRLPANDNNPGYEETPKTPSGTRLSTTPGTLTYDQAVATPESHSSNTPGISTDDQAVTTPELPSSTTPGILPYSSQHDQVGTPPKKTPDKDFKERLENKLREKAESDNNDMID